MVLSLCPAPIQLEPVYNPLPVVVETEQVRPFQQYIMEQSDVAQAELAAERAAEREAEQRRIEAERQAEAERQEAAEAAEEVIVEAQESAPAPAPTQAAEPAPQNSSGVWDRLAECESHGEWGYGPHSNWGNGLFEGGLQFHPNTWDNYKPAGYPEAAYQASRAQQIAVAERVLAEQGWRAWPACSLKLGLR